MDENPTVVKEPVTVAQPSDGKTQVNANQPEISKSVPATPAPAGAKTDPELLLKSLQEERENRRLAEEKTKLLEEEINTIKTSGVLENEVFSDEGKTLEARIKSVQDELSSLREEKELEKIYTTYPQLKEIADDFTEYRKAEHPRAKLESVAKLFLAEKGLLEPKRQGLENPTGGTRTPMTTCMTSEQVKHLRETNYKKYIDMVKKDQIKIEG